jgi:hypothetical protein
LNGVSLKNMQKIIPHSSIRLAPAVSLLVLHLVILSQILLAILITDLLSELHTFIIEPRLVTVMNALIFEPAQFHALFASKWLQQKPPLNNTNLHV